MSDKETGESRGLLESLSLLGANLVAITHTRLELLSIDLEEEREYLLSILLLSLAAVFLLGIGVVLGSMLLVVAFWETHRLLVLSILTTLFLVIGTAVVAFALYKVRTKPRLFSASLAELQKDHHHLSSRL